MEATKILQPLDYLLLFGYFAIVLFIGVYFKKYIRQAKDYFAAGASVPWWLSGISLWMSSFSATFFVIYSQIAFKYGLVVFSITWAVALAMVVAALFTAVRWRRARVMTPLGFMEQRYNKVVHQVFVWTGFPLRLIDNALRILATAIFLVPAIGQGWYTLEVSIIVVGTIIILYSVLGGQWAVLVIDFFQFIILGFVLIAFLVLTLRAVGGVAGLASGLAGPDIPATFMKPIAPPYDLFYWIMFLLTMTLSYNASWGLVQKYNCVATEKDARKVAVFVAIMSFVGPLLFFIPAMAARFYLPKLMGAGVVGRSDEVFVLMALKILPIGIMGMLVAGLFSATLATLGNEYNVLSGVLTKDFYQRMIRPDADERRLVRLGRWNTVLIGALTTLFALGLKYLREVFNLIDILVKIMGAFGPAIMIPYLAGLFIKKINSRGAIAGVTAGTISGVSLIVVNAILLSVYRAELDANPVLSYWLKQGWNSAAIGVNILATVLGLWLGSRRKAPADEQVRAAEFMARMAVPSVPAVETEKKRTSPFGMVGICLMIYGAILFIAAGILLAQKAGLRAVGVNLAAAVTMVTVGYVFRKRTARTAAADGA
jgi:SSS family solute:Na+ symporter